MTRNLVPDYVTVRTLRILAAVLTAITGYKFLAITAMVVLEEGWRPELLPWGFLAVISGPFVVAMVVIRRFPRTGAAALMLGGAVLAVICVLYLVTQGMPESVASDLPLLVLGGPLGAAGVALAGRFLLTSRNRQQTA